ncbi:uncharacterized protein, partial [Apostichopus japonicus]|uniref:uncharacterized protein n=1 Tax=Stichopus japonicus TaxID=307972 RepID=UPI003AB2403F
MRAATRTFPGADVGSDHDLVIMNFKVKLKIITKPKYSRLKFNWDKLKDPSISETFKMTIGGIFAPLLTLDDDAEALTTRFNEVLTETAGDILGKYRRKTQPWVTDEILEMCDTRRALKNGKTTRAGADAYRHINKKIRKDMNKAKEGWIENQCSEIEKRLSNNNTRRSNQLVKHLTKQKQPRGNTLQDKEGNCLMEGKEILNRWTEYCSELYNHELHGDEDVLITQESSNDDDYPILRGEVETAIRS